jgi:hypothetical protein
VVKVTGLETGASPSPSRTPLRYVLVAASVASVKGVAAASLEDLVGEFGLDAAYGA